MKKQFYINLVKALTKISLILLVVITSSCSTIPDGVSAITPFDKTQYLGKWYEIARTDNRFEEGLKQVTATYSMNEDGSIKVINKGYDPVKKEWEKAIGKAKFVKKPSVAMLKVSFFGPFYSGYNVVAIDKNYKYAFVIGDSVDNAWILSREKTIPAQFKNKYLAMAKNAGVKIEQLIWVEH